MPLVPQAVCATPLPPNCLAGSLRYHAYGGGFGHYQGNDHKLPQCGRKDFADRYVSHMRGM